MRRRNFLKNTVMGMAAFAGTNLADLRAEGLRANAGTAPQAPSERNTEQTVGRPVRIVSIGFKGGMPLSKIVEHVDAEASRGSEIIVLPELCRGHNAASEESLHGPTVTAMAALAKKHKTYIAVPIDRRDGNRRLNSVVLIDRSGQVACVYDKVFPSWGEYLKVHPS